MPVYSRQQLSGSTNGRPIGMSTASAGTEIHTVQSTSTAARESLWLWARNNNTDDALLTVVLISATATNEMPVFLEDRTAPNTAYKQIFAGLPLTATDTSIRGYTATISAAVSLTGYINRITT